MESAIRDGWFDGVIKVPATEFDALVEVAKRQVAEGDLRGLVGESLYRIYAKIPPEWKIRSEADVAQIRAKGYAAAYKGDKRPVTLVGVNFRTAKRNIDEPLFAKF